MTLVACNTLDLTGSPGYSLTTPNQPSGSEPGTYYLGGRFQASSGTTGGWEYLGSFGFTNAHSGRKVSLYAGQIVQPSYSGSTPTTAYAWSFYSVLLLTGSLPYQSTGTSYGGSGWTAYGYELDVQNNIGAAVSSGSTIYTAPVNFGTTSYLPPSVWGLNISALGGNGGTITGAMVVNGGALNYGVVFAPSGVIQYNIWDVSNSNTSYRIEGTHLYGIDTTSAQFSTYVIYNGTTTYIPYSAIRLGNSGSTGTHLGQRITGLSANGSVDVDLIQINGGNHVVVGSPNAADIWFWNTLLPVYNETYDFGSMASHVTNIYTKNAVTVVSSESAKTDIVDLPSMVDIVLSINAKSFKFITEGAEPVDSEVQVEAPLYLDVPEVISEFDIQNGSAVRNYATITRKSPIYDAYPVIGPDGIPETREIPASPAVLNDEGQLVTPEQPARTVPVLHRSPRLGLRTETKREMIPAAGTRTHFGFLAGDVKRAFDAVGVDFAGYVSDSEGHEGLRPDELLPILWKAVQELITRIAALEAHR